LRGDEALLKAGIVGLGRMGITHYSILNTHPNVKIVAVCDKSKLLLNVFSKYFDVSAFSEHRKMIEGSELDFIVVSTPTSSHTEIANMAIERNMHCFVEKPFSINPVEGKKTLALLDRKSLVNQVGYVNRFNEIFMETKKILDAGLIGEIEHFKFEMFGRTITEKKTLGWRGQRSLGGGCLYEFGSHCIDLVIFLIGMPQKVRGSILKNVYSSDVEDIVTSTFLYANGCSGTILVNWSDASYRKPANKLEIFGTKGKLVADRYGYKIFLSEDVKSFNFHEGWNSRYITDLAKGVRFYVRGNEFTRQLDYFIDCIKGKGPSDICSFNEALKTDIIIEKIIQDFKKSSQC
jgi:predicted dehydrogenase